MHTLWKALETEHIPNKRIRLLKATYHGSTSVVQIRAELSEEFTIKTGVRQGDVASPLLFNTVVDAIMREAFKGKRGVQFGLNKFLTDLMFADDSAIFADADEEATNILYNIAHIAQSYGLKINAYKRYYFNYNKSDHIQRKCLLNKHADASTSKQPHIFSKKAI